jgi:hypothetical protein
MDKDSLFSSQLTETMLKSNFFKISLFLSFLTIFHIAAGIYLVHPSLHEHECAHDHESHDSDHDQQQQRTNPSGDCAICDFLATLQLVSNTRVPTIATLAPCFEQADEHELIFPQKSYYRFFLSRAPPLLTFS